jgi:hypothetical protein
VVARSAPWRGYRGAWYMVPAKSNLVFSDPKDLWSTLVKGAIFRKPEQRRLQDRPSKLPVSRLLRLVVSLNPNFLR